MRRPPLIAARCLLQDANGQSLLETALFLPVLLLVMAYAVDYGYFFFVAADLASASRNAMEYSIQGSQAPAQSPIPAAGPIGTAASIASLAVADVNLLNASTTTAVQVCSASLGMNGNIPNCSSYGPGGAAYTPATDPEAPTFVLQRVDITYTVQPPVPLRFFNVAHLDDAVPPPGLHAGDELITDDHAKCNLARHIDLPLPSACRRSQARAPAYC
jgi:Flp pilus assembly protein TadG